MQDGAVQGYSWLIHNLDGSHSAGMAGSYRADPDMAIGATQAWIRKLHTYAAEKRLNPTTISKVM